MLDANPIHYIVSRSRNGWAVNVDADLLSEHATITEARVEALMLTSDAQARGADAIFVDLAPANDDGPGQPSD